VNLQGVTVSGIETGWQQEVGSANCYLSFAKEPHKNKALLPKSPTAIRLFCQRGPEI